jgi:hypothetical protein
MTNPLRSSVLAVICQIEAIAENAIGDASDVEKHELVAIRRALVQVSLEIGNHLSWLQLAHDRELGRNA